MYPTCLGTSGWLDQRVTSAAYPSSPTPLSECSPRRNGRLTGAGTLAVCAIRGPGHPQHKGSMRLQ